MWSSESCDRDAARPLNSKVQRMKAELGIRELFEKYRAYNSFKEKESRNEDLGTLARARQEEHLLVRSF